MNIIEAAKSGRSSCRGCKEKIEKGELRYGNYDEQWESYKWFHLACGAAHNLEGFQQAVTDYDGEIENLDEVMKKAKEARKGKAFPRVEEAPSARSSCLLCEEKIAPKGTLRVVTQREVEGFGMRPAYLHLGCAASFLEADSDALVDILLENSILTEDQEDEVADAV